jgi:Fic family protein
MTRAAQPPYSLTPAILSLVAEIAEAVGRISAYERIAHDLRLRRINRIRTIHGTLAVEGNGLDQAQITALLDGKRVLASARDVQEAHNAIACYERMPQWQPSAENDLLVAHALLVYGLIETPGRYRSGDVGVMAGREVIHMGPPAKRVPELMAALLARLATCDHHPLIVGAVFHYEFEFIPPSADGNGRMGRLWQTLILSRWNPLFAHVPVESLVHADQQAYYDALQASTDAGDSSPFIDFMLRRIREALHSSNPANAPQISPPDTPQVERLLVAFDGEMSREQLQVALGLLDRKYFRERYLLPALNAGLIEYTLPDTPNSRLQRYRLAALGAAVRGQGGSCVTRLHRRPSGEGNASVVNGRERCVSRRQQIHSTATIQTQPHRSVRSIACRARIGSTHERPATPHPLTRIAQPGRRAPRAVGGTNPGSLLGRQAGCGGA